MIWEVPAAATLKGQDSYGLTPATLLYMLCICNCAALVEILLVSTLLKNDEAWLVAGGSWLAVAEEVGYIELLLVP